MYMICHGIFYFDDIDDPKFWYTDFDFLHDYAGFSAYETIADFILDLNKSKEMKKGLKEIRADFLDKNKGYGHLWDGCKLDKETGILMAPLAQLVDRSIYIWKMPDFSKKKSRKVRDMRKHNMIDPEKIKVYYDKKASPQIYTDYKE